MGGCWGGGWGGERERVTRDGCRVLLLAQAGLFLSVRITWGVLGLARWL